MKNSDMKVIAIILSIALFFTIVTSNAVSIASVVFLAKGQTATEGTVGEEGTATTPDAGTATTPDAGTATTPDAGTASTPETTAPAVDSNANANTNANANNNADANKPAADANKPAGNAGALSSDEALAMFQKAAKEINTKGVAGYTKLSWQEITAFSAGDNATVNDALKGLIGNFMTSKEKAESDPKISEKGSEDAMRRMPTSNCSKKAIKSVNCVAKGSNYEITIVMNSETNPTKAATDGLNVMSRDLLYMEDVHDTVKNDPTVSKIVTSLNKGEITYPDYTITAEMTKDGKFVNITHKCAAELVADADGKIAVIPFSVSGSGTLVFNVVYKDFKY